MAKVAVGQWVPHVEAFVDVSRPPVQHSASVDALAALVNKDKLTLFDLVSKMEMYLTTTDHIVRSRGILLLGEILCRISFKQLDVNAISTLSDFFISRLSDWQALRGALVGCLALLHRKRTVGSIIIADVKRLLETFLQNVQVQSLAAADRKLCFQILNYILDHYPEAVKTMGDELLYGICEAIDEEKDPECLKLSFNLVEAVMKLFPDPSGLAAQYASEVFEILSKYYPIYFTHGVGDDLDATRDDLSKALMHAFCSTPYFEPFAIPLLLDKLSSSLPLAKLDSLKYLDNCIRCYGADRMGRHVTTIWFKLKEVIFSLSIDQILSTSGAKDMEKNKNEVVSEALTCLKTAITQMGPSDEVRLINLILLDEDIVNGRVKCSEYVVNLLECYCGRVLPWLFNFGGVNELALNFAMRLWNEIRDLATSDRIGSQDLLSSLLMGMKLVVGICTEEQQSLIVQKAYDTISSMLSLPVKSMTRHLLAVDEPVPLYSVRDTSLMCMLSSVIVGLRPQTPVPDMLMMINLFTVFLLKGQIPAAHALASIFNKNLHNSEFSHENKLDKVIDTILERCFSTISLRSNMKTSLSYAGRSDDANCSEILSGSIESKNNIISGLAWLGKGLLMRGDEKVKDVSLFLLKCLYSDQSLVGISSHQEEYGISDSSYASLATSAADAFHVMMSDSEACLNKKFHARIKPLYKQRFFSILMPIFLSKIKESTVMTTKLVLYRAFGHIISNAPVPAVITEAHRILLVMVDSLAKLSQDVKDNDLVYSILLVLSGMLMDEKGKECIVENIHIIVSVLTQLVSYPHMMVVRETALQCLVAMSILPHSKIYRMRPQILQAAIKALDDKKRRVRQEAVRCRQTWQSFA
uniref:MMS19 nucleotide excision repair protein n=1 Tax=Oryza meridionalis TaxID=40149 RepID=A0A0E0E847_9ORYZ